jgi:predicted nucleic acid-binding protein
VIVVDASVALTGLLHDGESRTLLSERAVVCPHLADSELAHALRTRVRRGEVDATDAARALDTWSRLGIERIAVHPLLERVWQLRDNLSAYDATYVALAEALDAPLVTSDARLAGATGPRCTITVVRR